MSQDDEITVWMSKLAETPPEAAEKIWNHYYDKLIRYAARKLGASPRRVIDEEDIVLSAMHSLHKGLVAGRFPKFENREDLWRILLTITGAKAKKAIRHQMTQKRGGGEVRGESVFAHITEGPEGLGNVAGREPTPEFAEVLSLECEELLRQLGDPVLQRIALMKLQGHSNEDISDEIGCALRSVERKLNRIRSQWADAADALRQA